MNRDEALKALEEGEVLTHRYFTSDEWMYQDGHHYVFEDGVHCPIEEFWRIRRESSFGDGWAIKEGVESPVKEFIEVRRESCK